MKLKLKLRLKLKSKSGQAVSCAEEGDGMNGRRGDDMRRRKGKERMTCDLAAVTPAYIQDEQKVEMSGTSYGNIAL